MDWSGFMQLAAVICGLIGVVGFFRLLAQCEDPSLAKYDEHWQPKPAPLAPVPAALLACAPANDAETLPARDADTQPASRKRADRRAA